MHSFFLYLIAAFILLGFSYCTHADKSLPVTHKIDHKPDSSKLPVNADTIDHTKYPEIYSFLRSLIKNHDLDTSFGLRLEPELACDLGQTDMRYLKKNLLIKEKKETPIVAKDDTINIPDSLLKFTIIIPQQPIISISSLPNECLTYADINFMINNKPDATVFRWDNSRLCFNIRNEENYYNLSIPMFSKDHKIAVILIEKLCPGLCGTGMTYVYHKKGRKWIHTNAGIPWVH